MALTEQEQALVTKLLGDPTYFPIEFRRWLKDFIENSEIKINSSQIIGGGGGGGSATPTGLPAGIILPYATATIGTDVLPCNGAAISRTDYSDLWTAIQTTWGAGDGTTTFNVPDLRDRALYGIGSAVGLASTDGKSLGNRGGPSHRHQLSGNTQSAGANHTHGFSGSISMGSHSHQVNSGSYALGVRGSSMLSGTGGASSFGPDFNQTDPGGGGSYGFSGNTGSGSGDHSHPLSGNTSGDANNQDRPSFAGVQYVVTTGRSA